MISLARHLAVATAILWVGLVLGGRAEAGGISLLTPAGLSPGDSFRFVFVTDGGTNAYSDQISYYNQFVNDQAAGATYNNTVVSWVAIASTASVNAIDNVGQDPIHGVYLADGTLVTSSTTTSGMWSGSLNNPIDRDLSNNSVGNSAAWTGTNTDGTGYISQTEGSQTLGNTGAPPIAGQDISADSS